MPAGSGIRMLMTLGGNVKSAIMYDTIPDYPERVCATSVLVRMIDGLAFRFQWATAGLAEEEILFRLSSDSMNIAELTGHVWGLVNWILISISEVRTGRPDGHEELRKSVLEMLVTIREVFLSMDEASLQSYSIDNHPFWYMINGPISDALTHVGQINMLRRQAGNPAPPANVFLGLPPDESK